MNKFPIRVLMIGPSIYTIGDSGHSTFAIWRELKKGFDQLKVFARAQGRGGTWRRDGVEVELIRGVRRRELEFVATQFALVKRGYEYNPDVVVSQGVALGGWAAIAIGRICKVGTLIEVHSDDFVYRASFFSRNGVMQFLSGPVFSRASLIRVLSERMGEALVAIYGEHLRDRIRVLPPRVDTERFQPPANRKAPDGTLELAIVGRLCENKGQLRLINALATANIPVTLHIFGDGPDRFAIEHAAEQVRQSPLKIIIHGLVTHDKLAEALKRCDALIMYSINEGTPRAIMEAMAMGLPVITTNAGFCADIVTDGKEGIVLSSDPDSDLRGHLEALLADPARIAIMGDAALRRARAEFSGHILYPRYRELIAEAAIK